MGRGGTAGRAGSTRCSLVVIYCGWQFGVRGEGQSELCIKFVHREIEQADKMHTLLESSKAYGCEFAEENEALTPENTIPWQKFAETAET
jgi:hypothetical protein